LRGQREALESALNGAPLQVSLDALVRTATDGLGRDTRAAFYLGDGEGVSLHHVVGMSADYAAAVDGFKIGPESLACGLAAHTGQPVITADVRKDAQWQPWLWLAERFNYRGCWSFPIRTSAGKFVGTLAIYSGGPREATDGDQELCSLLTRTASIIISQHYELQARKQAEAALRESEARERLRAQELQTLLDLAPIGVSIALDPEGRDIRGNRASEALLGLPPGAQLSMANPERPPITVFQGGKQLPLEQLPMQRAVRGETVDEQIITIKSAAHTVTVLSKATPLYDDMQRPRGAIGAFLDITALKQAEEALRDADRRKDEFLATLAHELRNPLAPIRTGLEFLKGAEVAPERRRVMIGIMERQVGNLVRLVDDLVEISRITRGKIELRSQSIDIAAAIHLALETSRPLIKEGSHQINVKTSPETLTVFADLTRLAQVFANLLNNAAKFSPGGGSIEISCKRQGDEAVVTVRDNGRGISPEALPHIFEPFIQVGHPVPGGLGIGLALVRNLVELHGGTVSAQSAGPDQGSAFIVRLPLCESEPEPAAAAPQSPLTTTLPFNRVLIVDDNRDAADMLCALLESLGATVRAVYDGRAAAAVVEAFAPDAVLLDLGMPGVDGYETARLIRQTRDGQNLQLVALTGWGQQSDRAKTAEAGFDAHLTKPASLEALQEILSRRSERVFQSPKG
jgi:signal transduction histidine kinase/ActR/RegA family two-component response regulator